MPFLGHSSPIPFKYDFLKGLRKIKLLKVINFILGEKIKQLALEKFFID